MGTRTQRVVVGGKCGVGGVVSLFVVVGNRELRCVGGIKVIAEKYTKRGGGAGGGRERKKGMGGNWAAGKRVGAGHNSHLIPA